MVILKYICLIATLTLTLLGCASKSPAPAITQEPVNDISIYEAIDENQRLKGQAVRWGGVITNVVEVGSGDAAVLHLQISEYPLGYNAEPNIAEVSGGRFIARLSPPYKKANYYKERLVTIVGRLSDLETYPLADGETEVVPIVDVREEYAWESLDKEERGFWTNVFYSIGISIRRGNVGFGVGVVFH